MVKYKIALLTVLALLLLVTPAAAQDTVPVSISLFVDGDSLTLYVPGPQPVSLEGIGFQVTLTNQQTLTYFLKDFPAFLGIPFGQLPAPLCFRLQRSASTLPLPLECTNLVVIPQELAAGNIFWGASRLLVVVNGDQPQGLCPAGQSRCDFTFGAVISPPQATSPPTPTATPTPEPGAPITFRLIVDANSFTLLVTNPTPADLTGLEFVIVEADSQQTIPLARYFDVLALTNGIAQPETCFVLNRPDIAPQPPLARDCARPDLVYRPNIAQSDVFWYDMLRNAERDIAIYRNGTATGQICPAASTVCNVEILGLPAATSTPPVSDSPTPTPTLPPVASITPTPMTKTYPCEGLITGVPGALLNQVRVRPQPNANMTTPVDQGVNVTITAAPITDFGKTWYPIQYNGGANTGWLEDRFITPSANCP